MSVGAFPPRALLGPGELTPTPTPLPVPVPVDVDEELPPAPAGFPGCADPCAPEDCEEACAVAAAAHPVDPVAGIIWIRDPRDGELKGFDWACVTGRWREECGGIPNHCLTRKFFGEYRGICPGEQRAGAGPTPGFGPPPGGSPISPPGGGGELPFPGEPATPGFPFPPPGVGGVDLPAGVSELLGLLGVGRGEGLGALAPLLAALVQVAFKVDATLQQQGTTLAQALGPALLQQAQAQGGIGDAIRAVLGVFSRTTGGPLATAAGLAATADGQVAVRVLEAAFQRLRELATGILQKVFDGALEGTDALVGLLQELYVDSIEKAVDPGGGNLNEVAGTALRNALAAGLTAQLSSLLIEAVHPLKHIGMQQIAGFIADFGGFGDVAGALRGPTIRHALAVPADHRAAAKFRTQIPSVGEAQEQAFQRHIPLRGEGDNGPLPPGVDPAAVRGRGVSYAEVLRLHGFPEWWVDVLVQDVYVDPRSMDLARILDNAEADATWLAEKLREVGWEPRDVEIGTRALLLKTTMPGRARLLSVAARAYRDGQIPRELWEELLVLGADREEHRELYRRAAELERRGRHVERIASRVTRQYVDDLLTRPAVEQLLNALELAPEEVHLRLLEADLDRARLQGVEEVREHEATVRQVRSESTRNLLRQFRAGLVSRPEAFAWLVALGHPEAYAENVLDVATMQGVTPPAEGEPPIGTEAFLAARAVLERDVRGLVRDRILRPGAGIALLVDLGIPDGIARDIVGLLAGFGVELPVGLPDRILSREEIDTFWEPLLGVLGQTLRERGIGPEIAARVLRSLGLPEGVVQQLDDVIVAIIRRLFGGLFG